LGRLTTSGTISLNDVRNQFGASGEPDMAEYYRGGVNASRVHSYGSGHNTNVPTSGTLSLSNFYGAHRGWHLTCGLGLIGNSFIINYGYSDGVIIPAMGSILPNNYRGAVIMGMYRVQTFFKGTQHSMVIYMRGGLARNHFNYYTDGNITVYTSNASYFVGTRNGVYCTSWIWGSNYVSSVGPYSNGAVLSPETPQ
jgi:hypothetical protein